MFKYILGIQSFANADSGACIIKFSNNLVDYVAISEERLVRKKFPYTFPINSISYCLDHFNIELNDIDLLVSDWIREKKWKRSAPAYDYQMFDYIKEKLKFKKQILQINHHLAHAASCYYTSKFNNAAILIIDHNGSDLETNSYFIGNKNKISHLETYKLFGIGAAYSAVTKNILNLGTGGEGKTMGLAPYGGKNKKIEFKLNGIKTDFSKFMLRLPFSDILNHESKNLRANPIKQSHKQANKKNIMQKYFCDWAHEIQDVSEKILVHLGKDIKKKTDQVNICLAGGVALNCVANEKLFKKARFKDMYVFPACSDSGIPMGLSLWGYHNFFKKSKRINFDNAYTGKSYHKNDIIKLLTRFKIKYETKCNSDLAKIISEGNIVSLFSGKSEYGPRALGNRSILADPRDPNIRDLINIKVKHRELFRPFAPAVLEEYCQKYFELESSPFMLRAVKCKKPKKIPSAVHIDNSARVQTVNKKQNLFFYNLIKEFFKITNVPVLLNTSFNDAGEPLVETPLDALICFFQTKIDYLFFENYVIDTKYFSLKQKKEIYLKLKQLRQKQIVDNEKKAIKTLLSNFSRKEYEDRKKV